MKWLIQFNTNLTKRKKKKLTKDLIGFCYQQDIEEGLAGVIPTEEAIDILTKSYKSSDNYLQVRSQVAEICKAQVSRQTKLFDYFHTLWGLKKQKRSNSVSTTKQRGWNPRHRAPGATLLMTILMKKKNYINKDWHDHINSHALQDSGALEKKSAHADFLTQCIVLTSRSFVNMYRDLGYYWFRLGVYVLLGIGLATVFSNLGTDDNSIQVSIKSIFINHCELPEIHYFVLIN